MEFIIRVLNTTNKIIAFSYKFQNGSKFQRFTLLYYAYNLGIEHLRKTPKVDNHGKFFINK